MIWKSLLLALLFSTLSFGDSRDTVRYPAVFNGSVYVSHAIIRNYGTYGVDTYKYYILSSRDSIAWKFLQVNADYLYEVRYLGDRFVVCGSFYPSGFPEMKHPGRVWYSKTGSGGLWSGKGSTDTAWLSSDVGSKACSYWMNGTQHSASGWFPVNDARLLVDKKIFIIRGILPAQYYSCYPDSHFYYVSCDSCRTWVSQVQGSTAPNDWYLAKDFLIYEPAPAVESKILPFVRLGLERLQAYDVLGRPVSGMLPSGVYLGRGRIIIK